MGYEPPEGLLTLQQAATAVGINLVKLRQLVRSGSVESFTDPRDGRVVLVKLDDVRNALQPRRAAPVG